MLKNNIQNGQQTLPKSEHKSLDKISSCLKQYSKGSNNLTRGSITSQTINSIKKSNISFKAQKLSELCESITADLSIRRNSSNIPSSNSLHKLSSIIKKAIVHFKDKNVTLIEDVHGKISIGDSNDLTVKRFTWRNHNNIEVQIITYGARITSMKLPDKKGEADDIVLGFDKPGDYKTYEQHFFGATIGRITGPVENSTFVIDGKQYWINPNDGEHHVNGGSAGLDKVIWEPSVIDSKVVLSHVTPEQHEGFPGQLFVEITFELSAKNEFRISMEAKSTQPTIINLSNLCYFNLAGQHAGKNELHKHYVTINSRSYIDIDEDRLPTGKIEDSACTEFDLQVPILLKKRMNNGNGFDAHFCVNKDLREGDVSFVARALHPPSGRTLEVYSNQANVRFATGNDFGFKLGPVLKTKTVVNNSAKNILFGDEDVLTASMTTDPEENFILLVGVYEKLSQLSSINESNFEEILDLFKQINSCNIKRVKSLFLSADLFKEAHLDVKCFITAILQVIDVLKVSIPSSIAKITTWPELVEIVKKISEIFRTLDTIVKGFTKRTSANVTNKEVTPDKAESTLKDFKSELSDVLLEQAYTKIKDLQTETSDAALRKLKTPSKEKEELSGKIRPSSNVRIRSPPVSDYEITAEWLWTELQERLVNYILNRKSIRSMKVKSSLYSDDAQNARVIGKNGVVYSKHAGMAFQTQNFPNAIYHGNFPNSVLRPGETYQHKIIYKFWVQSGSPKKWLKRYSQPEQDMTRTLSS